MLWTLEIPQTGNHVRCCFSISCSMGSCEFCRAPAIEVVRLQQLVGPSGPAHQCQQTQPSVAPCCTIAVRKRSGLTKCTREWVALLLGRHNLQMTKSVSASSQT